MRTTLLAALFAALTAVGALIRIPIPPVPITLQTFFVFLAAGLLGPTGGFLSQCLYLAAGLLGLPIFSGGGGIGYIFDPRFGYLVGLPVAAWIMGILAQRFAAQRKGHRYREKTEIVTFIWIYAAGSMVIYLFGISFLFIYSKTFFGEAFSVLWAGFLIFIPTDLLKIVIGAWLTVRLRKSGFIASV